MEGLGRIGRAMFPWDTIDLSDSGVVGSAGAVLDASKASAEKIRPIMERFLGELCDLVERVKKADLKELLCRPHL